MGDTSQTQPASNNLLSADHYVSATPPGLTPNTRSEAEAALSANSEAQTDSAAPTTPLPPTSGARGYGYPGLNPGITSTPSIGAREDSLGEGPDGSIEEAKRAYHRPSMPTRTSTSNYADALAAAGSPTSPTSFSPHSKANMSPISPTLMAPGKSELPPIDLKQGVVPLHTGIGAGQAEAVKRVRPSGLSLGDLGRQQSWSEQDMKHIYSQKLMASGEAAGLEQGYSSAGEKR